MQLDFAKGYTNRSNANRFATKTAKLAKGAFVIVPRDKLFYVVPNPNGATPQAVQVNAAVEAALEKLEAPAKKAKAPKAPKEKVKLAPSVKKPYNIQKQRPKAHGIVRNSTGTVGDTIWNACDKLRAAHGGDISKVRRAMVVEATKGKGVNPTTAVLRFYLWRRFHGVRGRPGLKKAQPKAGK
jgi:hypothetical protein